MDDYDNLRLAEQGTGDEETATHWLLEKYPQLTPIQLKYIHARLTCPNKHQAALLVGLKPNTVYKWPSCVDEALAALMLEPVEEALLIRRAYLAEAMRTKVAGLKSPNEGIRQKVASEIIHAEIDTPSPAGGARHLRGVESTHDSMNAPATPGRAGAPAGNATEAFSDRVRRFLAVAPEDRQVAFRQKYEAWIALADDLGAALSEFEPEEELP